MSRRGKRRREEEEWADAERKGAEGEKAGEAPRTEQSVAFRGRFRSQTEAGVLGRRQVGIQCAQ